MSTDTTREEQETQIANALNMDGQFVKNANLSGEKLSALAEKAASITNIFNWRVYPAMGLFIASVGGLLAASSVLASAAAVTAMAVTGGVAVYFANKARKQEGMVLEEIVHEQRAALAGQTNGPAV